MAGTEIAEAWRTRLAENRDVGHFTFAPRHDCLAYASCVVIPGREMSLVEITVFAGNGGVGDYYIEWGATSEVCQLPEDDNALALILSRSPNLQTTPYDGAVAALAMSCHLTRIEITQLENSTKLPIRRRYRSEMADARHSG